MEDVLQWHSQVNPACVFNIGKCSVINAAMLQMAFANRFSRSISVRFPASPMLQAPYDTSFSAAPELMLPLYRMQPHICSTLLLPVTILHVFGIICSHIRRLRTQKRVHQMYSSLCLWQPYPIIEMQYRKDPVLDHLWVISGTWFKFTYCETFWPQYEPILNLYIHRISMIYYNQQIHIDSLFRK